MFGKLRLIKRDVLGFCSIMLLRLALAISVAKNNTCMMQSLFSWTLLNMILKKNLFFEHILFFSRDTNDFKLVFEQKTNWHFKNPASATKYFFFHYYFSFTLTRILELRVARHIPVYERVNPKNELKILETRTTFIAKRQTLLTDAMSLCLKNVTYV